MLPASSSPHVVPLPMSDAAAVDPEEAFVAALSSCHMLWFLSIAMGKGWLVESYEDEAEASLGKNEAGKTAITKVVLKPKVRFGGAKKPKREGVEAMHHAAHESCFLANSVNVPIIIVQDQGVFT